MIKQKGVSTLAGMIIIISAICLFFGGAFTYEYFGIKGLNEKVNAEMPNQTTGFPAKMKVATSDASEIVSWKTYTNTWIGATLQYPNTWKITENGIMPDGQATGPIIWTPIQKGLENITIDLQAFPSSALSNGCFTYSATDEIVGKINFNGLNFCKSIDKTVSDMGPTKAIQTITYSTLGGKWGRT